MSLTYWCRGPARTLRIYAEVKIELPDDRVSQPYVERALVWLSHETDNSSNEWRNVEEGVSVRSHFKNGYSNFSLVWWCNKHELRQWLRSARKRLIALFQ